MPPPPDAVNWSTDKCQSPSNYTETNGKFVFSGLNAGDVIYGEMTNEKFLGLTLKTTEVELL